MIVHSRSTRSTRAYGIGYDGRTTGDSNAGFKGVSTPAAALLKPGAIIPAAAAAPSTPNFNLHAGNAGGNGACERSGRCVRRSTHTIGGIGIGNDSVPGMVAAGEGVKTCGHGDKRQRALELRAIASGRRRVRRGTWVRACAGNWIDHYRPRLYTQCQVYTVYFECFKD